VEANCDFMPGDGDVGRHIDQVRAGGKFATDDRVHSLANPAAALHRRLTYTGQERNDVVPAERLGQL